MAGEPEPVPGASRRRSSTALCRAQAVARWSARCLSGSKSARRSNRFPVRPVLGQRPPGPVAAVPERHGERAGRHSLRRRGRFRLAGPGQGLAGPGLIRQRPQVGAPAGGAPVEAGQLGLQLDDPEHERGRALGHRRIPGLFEPPEQDLRLGLHRRPPGLPYRPHPPGDGRPLQQVVPGLARRAFGIAGRPRRPGRVAGGGVVPAEGFLPQRQGAGLRMPGRAQFRVLSRVLSRTGKQVQLRTGKQAGTWRASLCSINVPVRLYRKYYNISKRIFPSRWHGADLSGLDPENRTQSAAPDGAKRRSGAQSHRRSRSGRSLGAGSSPARHGRGSGKVPEKSKFPIPPPLRRGRPGGGVAKHAAHRREAVPASTRRVTAPPSTALRAATSPAKAGEEYFHRFSGGTCGRGAGARRSEL